jgi:hypothetical protein
VNTLDPDNGEATPFWIDTMCIPVKSENHKKALTSMNLIYSCAKKVLVLDNALMQLKTEGISPEEIGLQIMSSGWARRLWTLQEGRRREAVFYQFADVTQCFTSLNTLGRKLKGSFGSNLRAVLEIQHSLPPKSSSVDRIFEKMEEQGFKGLSCWPYIALFFKDMDPKYKRDLFVDQLYLNRAIRAVTTRTTSKLEDECLVFACLISRYGTDYTTKLISYDRKEQYRALFQPRHGVSILPSDIIFLDTRRYEEIGSRWIPRSFLTQASSASSPYRGVLIPEDSSISSAVPSGMSVYFSSVLLDYQSMPNDPASKFIIQIGESMFQAIVWEAGTTTPLKRWDLRHPAIILPGPSQRKKNHWIGVLVDMLHESDVKYYLEAIIEWHKPESLKPKGFQQRKDFMIKRGLPALKNNATYGREARHIGLVHFEPLAHEGSEELALVQTLGDTLTKPASAWVEYMDKWKVM